MKSMSQSGDEEQLVSVPEIRSEQGGKHLQVVEAQRLSRSNGRLGKRRKMQPGNNMSIYLLVTCSWSSWIRAPSIGRGIVLPLFIGVTEGKIIGMIM
jgi:hypothetical protein